FVPLPRYLIHAAYILSAVVILVACVMGYFVYRPPKATRFSSGPLHIVWSLHEKLSDFLQGMALRREFYLSLAVSLLLLIFQALAFWLVMRGAGLHLSIWIGTAVYLIVHLGTAIPNAPANVGSYQFFTVAGLTLFGVEKSAAAGFSLVIFTLLTLPLLVLGFAALSTSGINLLKLRRQAQDLASAA
ncbi:MAG: flippase-like domain-containing protein, partial [Blastocatellia bacterium]|nr:flippase-like domain-containing protein [Blastocatellia bacterium]